MTAFVVLALPRSRTTWLSRFLSYGDFHCGHDQARYVRGMEDVRAWLSQDCMGTVETEVARWWRLIRAIRPDTRIAVIRRPVAEVVESALRLDLRGVCDLNREALTAEMNRLDRALDQIERHLPDALSVRFEDLAEEATCARLFEHLLPYRHDPAWWAACAPITLLTDMRALLRYAIAHRDLLAGAARLALADIRSRRRARHPRSLPSPPGLTVREEPFDLAWPAAQALVAEHCALVGEPPDEGTRKNLPVLRHLAAAGALEVVTARRDGEMVGYLVSVLGPSLEAVGRVSATQTTFFASGRSGAVGVGMALQRASIENMRARGVYEIIMRAGVRGAGPRMGALYRRLGAAEFGQLYRLQLGAA